MINKIQIKLKKLHKQQRFIYDNLKRFNVIRAGRRFGKTELIKYILKKDIKFGLPLAYVSTSYKVLLPIYTEFVNDLLPIIKTKDSQVKKITLTNGTIIDFWSFENIDDIRSAKYYNICLDEVAKEKNLENHWELAVRPTLIDYKGKAIFISTPKGHNYFKTLDDKSKKNSNWQSFHFTSFDNPKLDVSEVNELKSELPDVVIQQEIYADYIDITGSLIKRNYIKYYDESDVNKDKLDIYIGIDLAISKKETADYTALAVIGYDSTSSNIYIIDVFKARLSFNEIINTIIQTAEKYKNKLKVIGIETVAFQSAVSDELLRITNLPIKEIKPVKDKVTRFLPVTAKYESGYIYHNTTLPNYFESELLSFPESDNDDLIDAISYAIFLTKETNTRILIF